MASASRREAERFVRSKDLHRFVGKDVAVEFLHGGRRVTGVGRLMPWWEPGEAEAVLLAPIEGPPVDALNGPGVLAASAIVDVRELAPGNQRSKPP